MTTQSQLLLLDDFIAEMKVSGSLEAQIHECALIVPAVDPTAGLAPRASDLLTGADGRLEGD